MLREDVNVIRILYILRGEMVRLPGFTRLISSMHAEFDPFRASC